MAARPVVYVLGSGGFAREIAAYCGRRARVVFVDDRSADAVSVEEYRKRHRKSARSVLGSGIPAVKRQMLTEIRPPFLTLIHAQATVLTDRVGEGTIVAPGAVVAPHAELGAHVLVNYLASVGHDSVVGDLCVISPNASIGGMCVIEEEVFLGAGANVKQGLRIGKGAVVGMGAAVTKDVPPGVTAVGVPARW